MILLVPYMPEVPPQQAPRLWQALVFILVLGISYLCIDDILIADQDYVDNLMLSIDIDKNGVPILKPEANESLGKRPLLTIAPSKGSWDLKRLFYANFIHGSKPHLLLNLIGLFAGVRICSTFLSFFTISLIYILGGSLGLAASMWLSSEISTFIPHVGSSAGIFALMGTYYVFNFRFRTRYFFWFPSQRGIIALRTSWFFFLDVILLEIVLSAAQFFPNRLDSVDHIAHVVGFISGFVLAHLLKQILFWSPAVQTRQEYLHWRKHVRKNKALSRYDGWMEILSVNPYNDQIKKRLMRSLVKDRNLYTAEQVERAFSYLSPTFIRLYSREVGSYVQSFIVNHMSIPQQWLTKMPYDSFIRVAKSLTHLPKKGRQINPDEQIEQQKILFEFITHFQKVHPGAGGVDRKVQLLISKLNDIMPFKQEPNAEQNKADAVSYISPGSDDSQQAS